MRFNNSMSCQCSCGSKGVLIYIYIYTIKTPLVEAAVPLCQLYHLAVLFIYFVFEYLGFDCTALNSS
jgi:hypothetical protein